MHTTPSVSPETLQKIHKVYALDTETTGLDHVDGDRVIEIGVVEIVNWKLTGREFHVFLNPEGKSIAKEAEAVHGISNGYLEDKPSFKSVASDFVEFISDGYILIQNAAFDVGFLDAELVRAGFAPLKKDRVIDNIDIARRRFPGSPTNLDALCRKLKVDNSARDKHGALLDAQLLAKVYIAMEGVIQKALDFGSGEEKEIYMPEVLSATRKTTLRILPTQEEISAHGAWVRKNIAKNKWYAGQDS
jgi:DNA polymerase-3 subunit epsilon